MPLEYEYNFYNYNKKKVISKIKELGGKKIGHYIFKIMVFTHPFKKEGTYIRVRDEGHRVTMTYKFKDNKSEFTNESEIIINNFDAAVNILFGIGCTKKYYYEKLREIWNLKNSEIAFDNAPGSPEDMEIESPTKKELDQIVKLLDIKEYLVGDNTMLSIYDEFGIIMPKTIDLTFNNVKKELLKLVRKNKKKFIKLIDGQKKMYKSLL
jgi:adenylate cyclase class 2